MYAGWRHGGSGCWVERRCSGWGGRPEEGSGGSCWVRGGGEGSEEEGTDHMYHMSMPSYVSQPSPPPVTRHSPHLLPRAASASRCDVLVTQHPLPPSTRTCYLLSSPLTYPLFIQDTCTAQGYRSLDAATVSAPQVPVPASPNVNDQVFDPYCEQTGKTAGALGKEAFAAHDMVVDGGRAVRVHTRAPDVGPQSLLDQCPACLGSAAAKCERGPRCTSRQDVSLGVVAPIDGAHLI